MAPTLPPHNTHTHTHTHTHFPLYFNTLKPISPPSSSHTLHSTMQPFHHPPSASALSDPKRGKKRGNYNCGRCGLPKKGHVCDLKTPKTSSPPTDPSLPSASSASRLPPPPLPRHPFPRLRRALSFDDEPDPFHYSDADLVVNETYEAHVLDPCGLPVILVWEVMKRLPPSGLLAAARVCRGWRDLTKSLWRSADELTLRVPPRVQFGFVASILQKCPAILRLHLQMESDLDSTMLACIAFSCRNLESMEISTSNTAVNRINGEELSRFVAEKRSLKCLKMEGCHNLGGFVMCSSSLSTLWLSDLHSLSKMVFNCPQLKEISLVFSRQENDTTDITVVVENLGRTCPRLQSIHIASMQLSNAAVLALTAAQLRGLRMLSLVLGTEITDASVAAIAPSYPHLELLDLSGSSITDSGIGIICNAFPETLSRLLLALCPNVTSSGIQFASAQLPLLEIMDCGMTICDPNSENQTADDGNCKSLETSISNLPLVNQKLIIKHNRLKKLSLWGCSGLDALYLNCPQLVDLNLNSCKNLHPERLLLQCPSLQNVHALGCQDMLIGAIQSQVCNAFTAMENLSLTKRLPDSSKRVRVPQFLSNELPHDGKKRRRAEKRPCNVHVH